MAIVGRFGSDEGPRQWPTRVQRSPGVVSQRMEERTVLVHTDTDRIYELNTTATRFWELLESESDVGVIQQLMLEEFEVDAEVLAQELARTLETFTKEHLVVPSEISGSRAR